MSKQKCSPKTNRQTDKLVSALDALYQKYNHPQFIGEDPLQFVYKYSDPADMEIAGFFASALAYGRVQQISKSLEKLFAIMGDSPAAFVRQFKPNDRRRLRDFKHRFNTGGDIADLTALLKQVINKHGSIEEYFLTGYSDSDASILPALTNFCDGLTGLYARRHGGNVSKGLMYLLANPTRKSACKRLNLFLRWMVRDDDVDAGLWKSIDPAKLIVPVDVHMTRLCGILGFHSSKNVTLKTAVEITENFAKIIPSDPVKYDFALSRIGIIENCNGKINDKCPKCQLYEYCRNVGFQPT
ncbi:MAG: TIGR02757 family protein [Phycisphaerae bacterium]|nr:TIGR02757 family protein [Phycisphaerae bacterium]